MNSCPLGSSELKQSVGVPCGAAEERVGRASVVRSAVFCLVLILFLSLLSSFSFAAEKKDKKSKGQATVKRNPVTEAAAKAGVKSCVDRMDQVSNFLLGGTHSGWLLMMPKSQSDKLLVSASMEVQTKEVPTAAYVSESFSPNNINGCSGLYETVVYWDSGCSQVAKKEFATLKPAGALSKSISVLDGGGNLKVFLMPAGKGCVAIKKELMQ